MAESAAQEKYEAEQAKLRGEADGDIRIQAPRVPEVNPEVYKDVIPMLFRGFLTVSARINDIPFVFKSLNQHEFEQVRLIVGPSSVGMTSEFTDFFLSYGVLMVNGISVLGNRERWIPKIARTFREFPPKAKQMVVARLSELNRKASNAVVLTEAYAMETYSRFRWAQLYGLDLSLPSVTGLGGTDKLGLNWAQLTWRALNHYEDLNTEFERSWENAKFIGGCFAGKGVQKVYNDDVDRRRKETEERIDRKDRLLRHVFEGLPLEESTQKLQGAQVVQIARTVDELAEQLEKSLRGEKDWHDLVIEAEEQKIRAKYQEQHRRLHEMAEARAAEFDGKQVLGESEFGLSAEEVRERVLRRRQLQAQALARIQQHPELYDGKTDRFLKKWNVVGSDEVESTSKDPSGAVPLVPPRDRGKPFRGG